MTIKNLILAALTSALVAMTSGKSFSMHHEKSPGKVEKSTREKLDEKTKAKLISIFETNEALHSAFFTYNASLVQKQASSLRDVILTIEDKKLKKLFKRTLIQLKKITKKQDQDKNNHQYNLVNKKLIEVLGKYDLGSTYNVYSCPMVKKVWVQNSNKMDKVHNPYASYMPHCGTKDTIY